MNPFSVFTELRSDIQKALEDLNFEYMTPIQKQSIKEILQSNDIIAKAKTGSGKTLAFIIPTLNGIQIETTKPQALIIVPTRELCIQIASVARDISKYNENFRIASLYGGVKVREQVASMQNGTHMIIATPGRFLDHLSRDNIDLTYIKTVILDEADKMLDMGFYDDIALIIDKLNAKRQTLLFSATLPKRVLDLAKNIQKDAQLLEIDTTRENIKEYFLVTKNPQEALIKAIITKQPTRSILFCNTKKETYEIEELLLKHKIPCTLLNGDLDQVQRNEAIIQLSNSSVRVLVATDIASRGLDIDDIDTVFNYKLPEKKEIYTHRIGRSARAQKSGEAISIFDVSQKSFFDQLSKESYELMIDENKHSTKLTNINKTLVINGGKKEKISPKDILGAFIKDAKVAFENIGRITIQEHKSYIAIKFETQFSHKSIKIKGKNRKIWII